MNLFEKISQWWHGKSTPYESQDFGGLHYERHWTARLISWLLERNPIKTIGVFIVGVAAIVSAYYAVLAYHKPPQPPPAKAAQPETNNQRTDLTDKNPIKGDSNKPSHPQPPQRKEKPVEPTKTVPPQTINAPNSAISINQSGGVTAHTVNIQQDRSITPEQQTIIINRLQQLEKDSIEICYSSGSPEQRKFAESLIVPLKTAGFNIIDTSSLSVHTPYGGGLSVIINSAQPYPKGAIALQKAFLEAKIESTWYGQPGYKRDKIWVNIGER